MNAKVISVIALLIGACTIGGCASMKGDSKSMAVAQPSDNVDVAYVAAVEKAANRQGVRIIWVSQPQLARH